MAVYGHFGMTKSGKSHGVEKLLSRFEKSVIYDDAGCFTSGEIFIDPSPSKILDIFNKYKFKEKYRIIIRPSRSGDRQLLSDRAIKLSSALGRMIDKNKEKNVQLVIDEADFVCTPHSQSQDLKFIINKGRHDNVDTHVIARNPNRIHTDIRANCSKIVTYKLTTALSVDFLLTNFGRENCNLIQKLPLYWRFEWSDTGIIQIFDEKNNLKSLENLKKSKGVENVNH